MLQTTGPSGTAYAAARSALLATFGLCATVTTSASSQLLEEVIVTAQARSESVQDVPITIDAVTGSAVSDRIMLDIDAFAAELPSLTISETPFQKIINIRGIGSSGGNRLYEQSVPLFVDGVFGGRAGQFVTPFFDVDRIEVVKGPQSIFFGKNASSGAIAIFSRLPTEQMTASIKAGIETEYDGRIVEATLAGPLGKNFGGRIAARHSKRGGYLDNLASGNDEPEIEDVALRGILTWDLSDAWSSTLKLETSRRKQLGRFEQTYCVNSEFTTIQDPFGTVVECIEDDRITTGALAGPFAPLANPNDQETNHEIRNGLVKITGAVFDHTLESLSAYSAYDIDDILDVDFSALGFGLGLVEEDFDQITQEFRLLSPTGGRFEYVFGMFFMRQSHNILQTVSQVFDPTAEFGLPDPPPDVLLGLFPVIDLLSDPYLAEFMDISQDETAYSAFGQVTFDLSERLTLKLGARFTTNEKDYDTPVTRYEGEPATRLTLDNRRPGEPVGEVVYRLSRSETSLDPVASLQWYVPASDIMVFVSAGKGTKSGGFEGFPRAVTRFPVDIDALEFAEEEATNYEIGFKSTFLGGSARLNGAAFRAIYKGLQLQFVDPEIFAFITTNAERSVVEGAELDATWAINRLFTIGGAVTYLDARFTDLIDPSDDTDYSGNRLPIAPPWSGNLFASARIPLFDERYTLKLRAQANHTGERFFDFTNNPNDFDDAYTTADLYAAIAEGGESWELSINVRNVTDEDDIRVFGNPSAITLFYPAQEPRMAMLAPGRTVHVSVQVRF